MFNTRELLFVSVNHPYAPYTVHARDKVYVEMINNVDSQRCQYFSYSLDLTKPVS